MSCYSQDSIKINGQLLNNSRYSKVVIQKFGIGIFTIAEVFIEPETGKFTITAPHNIEPGVYRFQYSQTEFGMHIDIIINGNEKEISFFLDVDTPVEQRFPVFLNSHENKTWINFKKNLTFMRQKIHVAEQFLVSYPTKNDKIHKIVTKEYRKNKQKYFDFRTSFINKQQQYWAKQMACFTDVFFANPYDDWRLQEFYAHESYWKNKTTNDSLLLNTPIYTDAVMQYIQYYMNPDLGLSEREMNEGFKKSIDVMVRLFGENIKTKDFIIKYLQMGFKEIGNEEILQYIDERYSEQVRCTIVDDQLQKRLNGYLTLSEGLKAPEIQFFYSDGSQNKLSDFAHEQIIIIFWASWCPHCMQVMPKLQEWAIQHPNKLVLAISLDDDEHLFKNASINFPNMFHYCDLQKWDGQIVNDYYITATPTLVVLNKDREFVSKHNSIESFLTFMLNRE